MRIPAPLRAKWGARDRSPSILNALNNRRISAWLLMLPSLMFLLVFVAYPLANSLYLSFFDYYLRSDATFVFVGLANYLRALNDPAFRDSIRATILLTFMAVPVEIVLGIAVATLLNEPLRGMRVAQTLLILPYVMTSVVASLTWKFLYSPGFGLLNYLLSIVGLPPSLWVADSRTALMSIALVDIWRTTPFVALVVLAGLQGLPREPFEAAKVDGARSWQLFRYLTIPMLQPVIGVALVIRMISSLQIFDTIMILTQGGPGTATETLNVHLHRTMFRYFDVGYGSAQSMILLLLSVLFCFVFFTKYAKGATE